MAAPDRRDLLGSRRCRLVQVAAAVAAAAAGISVGLTPASTSQRQRKNAALKAATRHIPPIATAARPSRSPEDPVMPVSSVAPGLCRPALPHFEGSRLRAAHEYSDGGAARASNRESRDASIRKPA